MKKIVFLMLLAMISCKSEKENPNELFQNDISINSIKSGRAENIVEKLYDQILEKDTVLQNLEKNSEIDFNYSDSYQKMNDFLNTSTAYYNTVLLVNDSIPMMSRKTSFTIKDSIISKKIVEMINTSQTKFIRNTKKYQDIIKVLDSNRVSISDKKYFLKILLTLNVLEKYQKDNLPKADELQTIIKNQEIIIKKIDSLSK